MKNFETKELILVALFAALTAIGGFLSIPMPFGVPFTLQPFFVIFAANLLGGKLAFFSQLTYLAIGLVGIPIFTQGGGPSYVLQPTFGYLVGFAVGAYIIGKIVEKREKTFWNLLIANSIGLIAFYFFGVIHLYLVMNLYMGVDYGIKTALWGGFLIFLPWDLIKGLLAAIISKEMMGRIEDQLPITKS
ncbi:biotin transporter BioY [Halonatronum saccharophilum]|uniref:biotin transporter BioY n=1 Tax=Halonatronum saccharophilum TaxID=150060 RepID=UPI000485C028|nr:biotin transporter BioY [Halonatronum saccharophilum]